MQIIINRYISGFYALNLSSYEAIDDFLCPDWVKNDIANLEWFGEREDENTLPLLGFWGLSEASALINQNGYEVEYPCFIANHLRACLDLIFYYTIHDNLKNLTGFLERYVNHLWEKKIILQKTLEMNKTLKNEALAQWIIKECSESYEFPKSMPLLLEENPKLEQEECIYSQAGKQIKEITMFATYRDVFVDLALNLIRNNFLGIELSYAIKTLSDSSMQAALDSRIGITALMQMMEETGPLCTTAVRLYKSGVVECDLGFCLTSDFDKDSICTRLVAKFNPVGDYDFPEEILLPEIGQDIIPANASPEQYKASLLKVVSVLLAKPEPEENSGPSQ